MANGARKEEFRRLLLEKLDKRELLAADASVAFEEAAVSTLIGERVELSVDFSNASKDGNEVGYGPYLDLIIPSAGRDGDDGLHFVEGSASLLNQSLQTEVLEFGLDGIAEHPFALDENGNPIELQANPGDTLVVVSLPIGSYVGDQPNLTVDFEVELDRFADVGNAMTVEAAAGYRYGQDALDNPNEDPMLRGSAAFLNVNPQVIIADVEYIGPENETTVGKNFVREYEVTLDVAEGVEVSDIDLGSLLPNEFVFAGFSSSTEWNQISVPEIGTISDDTSVSLHLDQLTGQKGVDTSYFVKFYVAEHDSAQADTVSPITGDHVISEFKVSTNARWNPLDERDREDELEEFSSELSVAHELEDQAVAVQESIKLYGDNQVAGVSAGDVLQYSLNFQVADHVIVDDLTLTATVPDGQTFSGISNARLFLYGVDNQPLLNVPFIANASGVLSAPISGVETVVFKLADELEARGMDSTIFGGETEIGLGSGVQGIITFLATIDENFESDFPSGDASVDEGDYFPSTAEITGKMIDPVTLEATQHSTLDDSQARVVAPVGALATEVYAINADTSFGEPVVKAGDEVTLRIQRTIRSSDIEYLVISDFLPMPVLYGDQFSFVGGTGLSTGDIQLGPNDSFHDLYAGLPDVAYDGIRNMIEFDYGSFDSDSNETTVIDLLVTVSVADAPFADGLWLTSHAHSDQGSTNNGSFALDALTNIQYTRPVLEITKGVVGSSNSSAAFSGSLAPSGVDFAAPGEQQSFQGLFLHEDFAAKPVNANIANVDSGDLIRVAVVAENIGLSADGAFDVTLTDLLPDGFVIPSTGLNLRVQDGAGNDLGFVAVDGDDEIALFGSGIRLIEAIEGKASSDGGNFVVITYDLEVEDGVQIGHFDTASAEVTHYAALAGGENYVTDEVSDSARMAVALPSIVHRWISTDQAHTDGNQVAIGENVTYEVIVNIPEASSSSSELRIDLQRGVAIQDLNSISWSDGITFSRSAEEILASARIEDVGTNERNQGRVLILDLGEMNNLNRDDLQLEQLRIEYEATVTNDPGNNDGDSRKPKATFTHDLGSSNSRASKVKIVEPEIVLSRNFSQGSADAGDRVTVTLDVAHTGSADAFDLVFSESLNNQWTLVDGSLSVTGADSNNFQINGGVISGALEVLEVGGSFSISYQVILHDDVHAGESLRGDAEVTWTSLPGQHGQINPNNAYSFERTGDPSAKGGSNSSYYRDEDLASLAITSPDLQLDLIATSSEVTSDNALTIGELATFQIVLTVPEGHHNLLLDVESAFEDSILNLESLEIVQVGDNLSFNATATNLLDNDNDGQWIETGVIDLGLVQNTSDNKSDSKDQIVFLATGRIVDVDANQELDLANFSAEVDYGFGSVAKTSVTSIVEPGVSLSASHDSGADALEILDVTVVISHNPGFSSDPQSVEFEGFAGEGVSVVGGSAQASGGSLIRGGELEDETILLEIDSLEPGESVELTLQIQVSEEVSPGDILELVGELRWKSLDDEHGREYSETHTTSLEINSSSLSGWSFVDENQDGIRQEIDTGLVRNVITLAGLDHLGNEVLLETEVSPTGYYEFADLRSGTYQLSQHQIESFADGADYLGSIGGTLNNDRFSNIVIPQGIEVHGSNYNFTESSLTWISGTVYVDGSQDGHLDSGEEGIGGVSVTLEGLTDQGVVIERELLTNERGYFLFGALPSGTYSLTQEQPEGYLDTVEEIGTNGGIMLENDSIEDIVIGVGNPGEYYNFGEYLPGEISGQIYIDYDRDLVRDRLDGLLSGIEVVLEGVNDLGEEISLQTSSAVDGSYIFEGLRPGNYDVSSVAIDGLEQGVSNVGLFLGASGSNASNGQAADYGFTGIGLPAGGLGRAYDIGHIDPNHIQSDLVTEYDAQYVFTGTGGDDIFEIDFSTTSATVMLNGAVHQFDSDERISLNFMGSFGDDVVNIIGSEYKEEVNIRDTSANLSGTWFASFLYGVEHFNFIGGGNEDLVRLYDTAGDEHLEAKPFEATWSGSGFEHIVSGIHRIYAYAEQDGQDSANLIGASGRRDNFIASPHNARLYDHDYYIWVEGFDSVKATANDLSDRAYLYGHEDADDSMSASEYAASMTGEGYELHASMFRYVMLNGGTAANDTGVLIGTYNDDTLNATPNFSTFDADETRVIAKGFERLDVEAVSGNDVANFIDSHYDDRFVADASSAVMSNSSSVVSAFDFDTVDVKAEAGGNDIAEVSGGSGADTFRAWSYKWQMSGSGVVLSGSGFTEVQATANSNADRAYLYDSIGNDVLELTDSWARMSGENFLNQANGFGKVVAESTSGGIDRAVFLDGDSRSTVRFNGEDLTTFGNGFSNKAIGFDLLDAIYDDLTGNDRVELSDDLLVEMILEEVDEFRYRLSLAAGTDGIEDNIRDRVSNLPIRETV